MYTNICTITTIYMCVYPCATQELATKRRHRKVPFTITAEVVHHTELHSDELRQLLVVFNHVLVSITR